MSAPHARQVLPVDVSDRGQPTAVLEVQNPQATPPLQEAELDLAIESAALRLLDFALAREGEELYADTE